ncbi:hypothetical protein DY000_02005685 [Brassica cretica]|uniref:Uncharacterized protein n=1 Tax=Brassica cretica TaxID=69181 RepID=A0ABQ7BXV0_BRACR|nr:hypothetical protein DY000_02005685 [Brassica cretica]
MYSIEKRKTQSTRELFTQTSLPTVWGEIKTLKQSLAQNQYKDSVSFNTNREQLSTVSVTIVAEKSLFLPDFVSFVYSIEKRKTQSTRELFTQTSLPTVWGEIKTLKQSLAQNQYKDSVSFNTSKRISPSDKCKDNL